MSFQNQLQAVGFFWLTLSSAFWWCLIAYDSYSSVVMEYRPTSKEKKKQKMRYDMLAWGVPTLLTLLYLSMGGLLGGDNEATLMFCFLGNTSIKKIGEAPDYILFFIPLLIIDLCGSFFYIQLIRAIYTASKNVGAAVKDSKMNKVKRFVFSLLLLLIQTRIHSTFAPHIIYSRFTSSYYRLVLFVTGFGIFFWFIFMYRVGLSLTRNDAEVKGFEWAKCHSTCVAFPLSALIAAACSASSSASSFASSALFAKFGS